MNSFYPLLFGGVFYFSSTKKRVLLSLKSLEGFALLKNQVRAKILFHSFPSVILVLVTFFLFIFLDFYPIRSPCLLVQALFLCVWLAFVAISFYLAQCLHQLLGFFHRLIRAKKFYAYFGVILNLLWLASFNTVHFLAGSLNPFITRALQNCY
ncbi:Putative hypothetical protein [Helicobacter mustelae 12198]|uniref:Uncharacterized protein n=1 Tax=Helicobacter mustelae (strain ATCC 43772 / CCUG 25715 / CIP 103759 / LMG 18044 / NCTC 12198 / R85-136P) TaxID=679897 RepID=D3UGP2_HELM1|nr:Putative hypothetical protein [Helicobacter mustelae 12198]